MIGHLNFSRELSPAEKRPWRRELWWGTGHSPPCVRIPLIVSAGSGIVITNSGDLEHPVGAKRR
jgi:hypothetical protein